MFYSTFCIVSALVASARPRTAVGSIRTKYIHICIYVNTSVPKVILKSITLTIKSPDL